MSNSSRIRSASFRNSLLGSPESAVNNESPSLSKFIILRFVLARSLLASFNVLGIFDMTAAKFGVGNVTAIIEHYDTSEIAEERSASTVDLRVKHDG